VSVSIVDNKGDYYAGLRLVARLIAFEGSGLVGQRLVGVAAEAAAKRLAGFAPPLRCGSPPCCPEPLRVPRRPLVRVWEGKGRAAA